MGLFAAGQVALLAFPFSDLSRSKFRPAVILSGTGREDWIVCQITSNPFGDAHSLVLTPSDFAAGMLQHVSYVRPGKLFTAHQSLIEAAVGTLKPAIFELIQNAVIAMIKPA